MLRRASRKTLHITGTAVGDNPVNHRVVVQLKKNDGNYNPPFDIVLATVNP